MIHVVQQHNTVSNESKRPLPKTKHLVSWAAAQFIQYLFNAP